MPKYNQMDDVEEEKINTGLQILLFQTSPRAKTARSGSIQKHVITKSLQFPSYRATLN